MSEVIDDIKRDKIIIKEYKETKAFYDYIEKLNREKKLRKSVVIELNRIKKGESFTFLEGKNKEYFNVFMCLMGVPVITEFDKLEHLGDFDSNDISLYSAELNWFNRKQLELLDYGKDKQSNHFEVKTNKRILDVEQLYLHEQTNERVLKVKEVKIQKHIRTAENGENFPER